MLNLSIINYRILICRNLVQILLGIINHIEYTATIVRVPSCRNIQYIQIRQKQEVLGQQSKSRESETWGKGKKGLQIFKSALLSPSLSGSRVVSFIILSFSPPPDTSSSSESPHVVSALRDRRSRQSIVTDGVFQVFLFIMVIYRRTILTKEGEESSSEERR